MLTDTASGYGLRIDASSLRSEGRRQSRGPRQDTRPNFFIALQVSQHAAVTDAISRVQQAMISRNPVLHGCAVDARRAHLTLLVMRVEDDDDDRWRAACDCLRALPARLQARGMLQPLQFALRGLSSFREQVLFLDVPKGPGRDGLIAFAEEVRSHFSDAQLLHPDSKPYVPHITVAKTSRLVDALGAEGARRVRISRELYEDLEAIDAGAVVVGSVQLCAMRGSGEDGYYPVEEMVSLESGQR